MDSINGVPGTFPIQTAMPLSFEALAEADQPVDFAAMVVSALENIDKLKKKADALSDDVYIYGKDQEVHDAAVADEFHGQQKKIFSSLLRNHTNLAQTLFNVQI